MSAVEEELPPALVALREQRLAELMGRVETLERAARTLAENALFGEESAQALQAAHHLAVAAAGFGFERTSELARGAEELLLRRPPPLPEDAPAFAASVAAMRADMDGTAAAAAPEPSVPLPPAGPAALPLALLVTRDATRVEPLRLEATRRGIRVVAARAEDVETVLARDEPAVMVVEASEMPPAGGGVPVVVLGGDRHAAARRGAVSVLAGDDPAEVADELAQIVQRGTAAVARVVTVGQALDGPGLDVYPASGDVFAELERVGPDAVVVADDLELCRVLRTDPRWAVVPLILVAEHREPETAFAAGADDVVAPNEDVAARVRGRVARARVHEARAEIDPLTGLANRRTSSQAFSRQLRLAERLGRSVSIVDLRPDSSEPIALRRLADRLRAGFRTEDVVAHWGGGELVLGLFGLDRDGAVKRITALAERYAKDDLGFWAGVAEYPSDGADLEELYGAAAETLRHVLEVAEDRVAGSGSGPGATQLVDVAIIEDDDATADGFSYWLGRRGHRCCRFSNGAGALNMLAGDTARVRARVILLDLELPAVDGMELLTLFARNSSLRNSRIIVFSSTDDQQLRARTRELGAEDFLTKPAETDLVIERVEALLGRQR